MIEFASKGTISFLFARNILIADLIMYPLLAPGCWNVYVFETGIGFKNYWLFYWKNKYKYKFSEIDYVKVTHGKYGPFIRVHSMNKSKRFYSIGTTQTEEFIKILIDNDVKIINEKEWENPLRQAWFPVDRNELQKSNNKINNP